MNVRTASSLPSPFDDGDVYDLVGSGIPYGLDFYVALARKAHGPVLDVACGTGRILLPCSQAGVDIEGLDLFEPMLRTLRAKAASLSLSPQLHQFDMNDFSLSRRYALVMIPFNAATEARKRCDGRGGLERVSSCSARFEKVPRPICSTQAFWTLSVLLTVHFLSRGEYFFRLLLLFVLVLVLERRPRTTITSTSTSTSTNTNTNTKKLGCGHRPRCGPLSPRGVLPVRNQCPTRREESQETTPDAAEHGECLGR